MVVLGAIAATLRGHRDEGAGGGGATADGRDVDDDRHLRCLDALDDLAHGAVEAAGRVEAEDDGARVRLLRRSMPRSM